MKKLFIFMAILSVSSIMMVNCKKKEIKTADLDTMLAIKSGSYGEYCSAIGTMSPEKAIEYQAKLKGSKVSWTVNAIGADKNVLMQKNTGAGTLLNVAMRQGTPG
jgi:hypothetical protein